MKPQEALKHYFGYEEFREGQEETVNAILEGRDVLAVMPTGSGKSICYQLPALLLPGITLVISPLISLMQDQVKSLNASGIRAAYINSSLSEAQIEKALYYASMGTYKIVYVAPERLMTQAFLRFALGVDISMVTVDEAHCISQWGQDFRPSYTRIVDFIGSLSKRPVVSAFTATATEEVKNDISCVLRLNDPFCAATGFDRPNLFFRVESGINKEDFVSEYLKTHINDSGIIYCATRKKVDELSQKLSAEGFQVRAYHAGMDSETRKNNQNDFIFENVNIVVATNAFGMGIDKSNVRYVIHYNMPQSMENYYQEAGRAGRDGEFAECILLFSAQDVIINKFLLDKKDFSEIDPEYVESIRQRDMARLRIIENYCKSAGCLRNSILRYFGEERSTPCGSCGNCCIEYEELDMTREAKAVINCICELPREYGAAVTVHTLLGGRGERIKEIGADKLRSYGILKDMDAPQLRVLIERMIAEGMILRSDDKYQTIRIGDISALKAGETLSVRKLETKNRREKRSSYGADKAAYLTGAGKELFDRLRELRLSIARDEGVPPYIVFGDKTLKDMCIKAPDSLEGMQNVSGIGKNKLDRYGNRFYEAIESFKAHNSAELFVMPEVPESEAQISRSGKIKRTEEFFVTPEEAEKVCYKENCCGMDLRNEMNRVCQSPEIKRITVQNIQDRLIMQGYLAFEDRGELIRKIPTKKGESIGIVSEQRFLKDGKEYFVLNYSEAAQREIVKLFTKILYE